MAGARDIFLFLEIILVVLLRIQIQTQLNLKYLNLQIFEKSYSSKNK